jgi:putative membrane protein
MGWDHMGGAYGFGWVGIGMFTMILFWILVIVAIVALWRGISRPPQSPAQTPAKTALQLLEERYARGEIGREEFVQKRDDLEGKKTQ